MSAFTFIDKMTESICDSINNFNLEKDIYEEPYNPIDEIMAYNLLSFNEGFVSTKFSEFILDESKRMAVILVLYRLENLGIQLNHCWTNSSIHTDDLSPKERFISEKIEKGEIYTFKDLIEAF